MMLSQQALQLSVDTFFDITPVRNGTPPFFTNKLTAMTPPLLPLSPNELLNVAAMPDEHPMSGSLFMVVAPSGAGKSTLVNALLAQEPAIKLSISYTTRPPRTKEQNGREYHFTSVEDFRARHKQGEFLEWAEVHGNYYGTSRLAIAEQMQAGTDVLLEIDWQGAQQVKKQFPHVVGIFILPPSIAALEDRLKKRGQDEPQVITRRILAAGGEIAHAPESEYVIINQEFATALSELTAIVKATRCRFAQQAVRNASLFAQLGIHANLS